MCDLVVKKMWLCIESDGNKKLLSLIFSFLDLNTVC